MILTVSLQVWKAASDEAYLRWHRILYASKNVWFCSSSFCHTDPMKPRYFGCFHIRVMKIKRGRFLIFSCCTLTGWRIHNCQVWWIVFYFIFVHLSFSGSFFFGIIPRWVNPGSTFALVCNAAIIWNLVTYSSRQSSIKCCTCNTLLLSCFSSG